MTHLLTKDGLVMNKVLRINYSFQSFVCPNAKEEKGSKGGGSYG